MQDFVNKGARFILATIGKSMGYSNSYMEVFLLDVELNKPTFNLKLEG